ncbi:hypothetical protein K443DRAFT_673235 [Laccaria amethystina LaAM-08-1]|uniref:Uncharacterized protein n=1 Tax=Laccaria amethystina LaAM-08-1 TaxID=1095629 RepID=A0A0C9YBK2_9AGAR|nr:hypothetical protein K443DRAFT_673235 [Laccaria amethystina LaAM-08-1]
MVDQIIKPLSKVFKIQSQLSFKHVAIQPQQQLSIHNFASQESTSSRDKALVGSPRRSIFGSQKRLKASSIVVVQLESATWRSGNGTEGEGITKYWCFSSDKLP